MTYVTYDPPGAPPPPHRRRSRALLATGAVAGALVLVAAVVAIILVTRDPAPADRSAPTTTGAGAPVTTPAAPATSASTGSGVAYLMEQLGCQTRRMIYTQLDAVESGSCELDGIELMLCTFDNDALRDQWVAAYRGAGSPVIGPRWAVVAYQPPTATRVAEMLGGKRL